MGLGAVADYQQNQREKLEKQRFADMIQSSPIDEGEKQIIGSFAYTNPQVATGMFREALGRSRAAADLQRRRQQIPALLTAAQEQARAINPRASASVNAEGEASYHIPGEPEPPKPKEPKAPQLDEYTEEDGGFQYKVMREKGADGKWVVTDRTKIGPAPQRGDKPDKPGAPTVSDYRARAYGEETGKPKVDRLSPAQALDRLSPAEQEAIRKEIGKRAKTVPQGAAKGGAQAPAMSDAAARLAARFKIGQ